MKLYHRIFPLRITCRGNPWILGLHPASTRRCPCPGAAGCRDAPNLLPTQLLLIHLFANHHEGSAFFSSSPVVWILVTWEFAVLVFILPESGTCVCVSLSATWWVACGSWYVLARLGALVWAGVIPDAKGDNGASPEVQKLSSAPVLLCYKGTVPHGIGSAVGSLGQSCLGSRTQTFGGFIFWSWCEYSAFCAQYNIKSTDKWKKPNRKLTLCPNSIYFCIIIFECYFSKLERAERT